LDFEGFFCWHRFCLSLSRQDETTNYKTTKFNPEASMKNILKQMVLMLTALFLMVINTNAVVFTNFFNFFSLEGGANPYASLVLSSNILYGTASAGSSSPGNPISLGTVFKVNTDGTGFTTLHSFNQTDGSDPYAGLMLSGNTLYGTTYHGGNYPIAGAVFKVNTDGTGFTNLYSFTELNSNSAGVYTNSDGANPYAGLALSGNTLYGTTVNGGSGGVGTLFKVNIDGTGFTNLYSFTSLIFTNSYGTYTNSDGANPYAGLIPSGNTLYGTTVNGGNEGFGTLFKVNADGTDFTNFYSFTALIYTNSAGVYTNSDGANPHGSLVLSSNILYGTALDGGDVGGGTIFKVNTNGTGFTNLFNFPPGDSDGAFPQAGLLLSGNILYGTTELSSGGDGEVFAINTDGMGFTNLWNFNYREGYQLYAGLILNNNTLYGTASQGGFNGQGSIFALSLGPIPLNIQYISNAVVLSWGNPAFSLQAATNVTGVYTNVTGAASPYSNTVISSQMFFRLQSQ
jgi:uncharacterized repeat protein (TIGR03803 family)